MNKKENPPAYSKVAFDIAAKIAAGTIREGEDFTKRSLAGSQYGVSQETIRRALGLLSIAGIIETRVNVGYRVSSQKKAIEYVEQYQARMDIYTLKCKLKTLTEERGAIDAEIQKTTRQLLDLAERFQHSDRLHNYEFEIETGAEIAGQTIGETRFRQKTGATIVAMRKGEQLILSPGPDVRIDGGDRLVVVCEYRNLEHIQALLKADHHVEPLL